jgi:hypothetical protein
MSDFTARQLDGQTCLVCGSEHTRSVPIGRVNDTQVFACDWHPTIHARNALADAARAGYRVTAL